MLISIDCIYAFTWDDCSKKYEKARQFSDNVRLSYNYLKSTKSCLIKFKNFLIQNPNPEFTVEAMDTNILMLDKYLDNLTFKYTFSKNSLEQIPKYLNMNSDNPTINKEYNYFKKFKNCNGVHANNKIYTAKHCGIKQSKNIRFDLNYIPSKTISKLKISKLKLDKKGIFKYYSMSKEGMYYNVLLEEKNCKFYKAKNTPTGLNTTLDYTDLEKKEEIRSDCLAIPSNSGGGVFQDGKLVGIISKTVFNKNKFLYSVVEPILPFHDIDTLNTNNK
ncbi:MAG: hypothetical protein ACNI25_01680 [Halarcobacter sp.]